jgi:hypothetical protein
MLFACFYFRAFGWIAGNWSSIGLECGRSKIHPQRLKPLHAATFSGMAEAVPLHSQEGSEFEVVAGGKSIEGLIEANDG